MKKIEKLLFASFLSAELLTAQTDSTLEYFPFHPGDTWQYKTQVSIPYPPTYYETYTIVTVGNDTLMPNGKIYRRMNRFEPMFGDGFYRIDSTTACVYKYDGTTQEILTDSLKATAGDQWEMGHFRCDSIYTDSLFSTRTTLKAFVMPVIPYPIYFHFAKGFGLVYYSMSEENWVYPVSDSYVTTLVYAKINGHESGTLVSVKENRDVKPKKFLLEQNYPNPFNPSTTIRYELPKTDFATLKIFDLLGREIAIVVNEEQNAGSHSVEFSTMTLSSGMYFYTLHVGNFTTTKRMMLLK